MPVRKVRRNSLKRRSLKKRSYRNKKTNRTKRNNRRRSRKLKQRGGGWPCSAKNPCDDIPTSFEKTNFTKRLGVFILENCKIPGGVLTVDHYKSEDGAFQSASPEEIYGVLPFLHLNLKQKEFRNLITTKGYTGGLFTSLEEQCNKMSKLEELKENVKFDCEEQILTGIRKGIVRALINSINNKTLYNKRKKGQKLIQQIGKIQFDQYKYQKKNNSTEPKIPKTSIEWITDIKSPTQNTVVLDIGYDTKNLDKPGYINFSASTNFNDIKFSARLAVFILQGLRIKNGTSLSDIFNNPDGDNALYTDNEAFSAKNNNGCIFGALPFLHMNINEKYFRSSLQNEDLAEFLINKCNEKKLGGPNGTLAAVKFDCEKQMNAGIQYGLVGALLKSINNEDFYMNHRKKGRAILDYVKYIQFNQHNQNPPKIPKESLDWAKI